MRRLHAAGFTVLAWGVRNEEMMRAVVQTGADGMTIDFPDKLLAYLETRGEDGAENGRAQGTS